MGFEIDLFVKPVHKDLLCEICFGILDTPTTVCHEGHVFCEECIDDWDFRSDTCPKCRTTMTSRRTLCRPVQNMIMDLQVCCPEKVEAEQEESGPVIRAFKRARGNDGNDGVLMAVTTIRTTSTVRACGWQGTLSDYLERHKHGECQFRNLKCPLDCGETMRAFHLQKHVDSECMNRKVKCPDCRQVMKHRRFASHQKVRCPEAVVTCRLCKEEMPRKLLTSHHHSVCPQVKVSCAFHAHGCTDEIKRGDVTQHMQDFLHKHLQLVATSATQTKAENQVLKQKVDRLEKQLKLRRLEGLLARTRNIQLLHSSSSFSSSSDEE